MAGLYSGDYPTGDPNKPAEVRDLEAIRAYELQLRGHDLEYISKALGLAPRTVQRRISELILARERPMREVMRWLVTDRIEGWTRIVNDRLDDDELSNGDAARLIGEGGRLVDRLRALYALDEAAEASEPDPDEEPDNWVDGARAEADAELSDIEIALRNGRAS